jgi:hypothetical protein
MVFMSSLYPDDLIVQATTLPPWRVAARMVNSSAPRGACFPARSPPTASTSVPPPGFLHYDADSAAGGDCGCRSRRQRVTLRHVSPNHRHGAFTRHGCTLLLPQQIRVCVASQSRSATMTSGSYAQNTTRGAVDGASVKRPYPSRDFDGCRNRHRTEGCMFWLPAARLVQQRIVLSRLLAVMALVVKPVPFWSAQDSTFLFVSGVRIEDRFLNVFD